MTSTFLSVGLIIFCFVSCLFILSLIIKRNDIADVAWGTGILLTALSSYLLSSDQNILNTTLLILIALWGLRLTLRIGLRNRKKGEDFRYKKWREEWGRTFYLRSYLQVYLLQGFLMLVVGYSAIHASTFSTNAALSSLYFIGIVIWIIGYCFEVIGDWQLDKFINSQPREGAIMQTGLWKYSRHPNYFGEVTMWWGLWLIISPLPLSYLALISPLTITFLILKVSGIPMLEKKFEGNPNWAEYKRVTSAFFPLPPKK